MNPLFQALTGGFKAPAAQGWQTPVQPQNGPVGMLQDVVQRAQQIAWSLQNPQQLVQRYFPDAPAEVTGNPDQLLQWMLQTGKVNPQMVQTARQMMGR